MIDYNTYRFEKNELIKSLLLGSSICIIVGWLFFGNIIGILLSLVYLPIYLQIKKKEKHEAKMLRLRDEFKDALNSLTAALEAGYSMENAIKEATRELELIYEQDAVIITEFKELSNKIRNNVTVEAALWDFASRSNVDDITYFTEVFITAKRTGGNLLHILRQTRNNICDKVEMNRELAALISAKVYEVKIMKIVPLGILTYLKLYNYEMIAPLYESITGNIVMVALLAGYLGLCRLADKMTDMRI